MSKLAMPRDAVVCELLIADGAMVTENVPVLRYAYPQTSAHRHPHGYTYLREVTLADGRPGITEAVVADARGTLQLLVGMGDELQRGTIVATIIPECTHEVQFGGMCASCGKDVTAEDASNHHMLSHTTTAFTIASSLAEGVHREAADRLRKNRKLSMILDLDLTLIHASCDPAVGPWMDRQKQEDLHVGLSGSLPLLFGRPGLRQFLEEVHNYYELHVYTMGVRSYADKVAQILDPNQHLFAERILSRNESGNDRKKSLERLFPCDQSMVVVIDDRGDVWDWSPNLIRAFPYTYFVSTSDINAPPGSPNNVPVSHEKTNIESTSATKSPQKDVLPVKPVESDRELEFLLRKLKELHAMYYEEFDKNNEGANVDVRIQLPKLKHRVLGGCNIIFSGLFDSKTDHTKTDVYQLAINYGAKYMHKVTSDLTHVIGHPDRARTAKIAQAWMYPHIAVVRANWIYDSVAQWQRQNEASHMLEWWMPTSDCVENEVDNVSLKSSLSDVALTSSSISSSDSSPSLTYALDIITREEEIKAQLPANEYNFLGAVDVLDELQAELDEFMASDGEEDMEKGKEDSEHATTTDNNETYSDQPDEESGQSEADLWAQALDEEEEQEQQEISTFEKLKRKRTHSPTRTTTPSVSHDPQDASDQDIVSHMPKRIRPSDTALPFDTPTTDDNDSYEVPEKL